MERRKAAVFEGVQSALSVPLLGNRVTESLKMRVVR